MPGSKKDCFLIKVFRLVPDSLMIWSMKMKCNFLGKQRLEAEKSVLKLASNRILIVDYLLSIKIARSRIKK